MRKQRLCLAGLALAYGLVCTGCGDLPTAGEAEAMLESVYMLDFTYIDSAETTTETGANGMLYTFQDPAGGQTQLLSYTQDGEVISESDRTQKALIQAASVWDGLCEDAGIPYLQEDGVWRLLLEAADTEEEKVYQSYRAAELICAMLEHAPIFEIQTEGYAHSDVIEVYYQDDSTGAFRSVYLSGYNLAQRGIYSVEFIAGDLQLWMREAEVL